jgi:hypothetical protein
MVGARELSQAGYVYVLLNPSMEGMVKIGKTTRDPENRVSELSSATGVPTPFILIYKEYFTDCTLAETMIHQLLEQRDRRVASNREFFSIASWEAINAVQDVKKTFESDSFVNTNTKAQTSINTTAHELAQELLQRGEDSYYGFDNNLVDYKESLSLFQKAAKFGAIEAYEYLGRMYQYGEGCKENLDTAIEYYKKGASLGYNPCNASLGYIFWYLSKHIENGKKCWNAYFENLKPQNATFSDEDSILNYLILAKDNDLPIEHKEIIMFFKKKLIYDAEKDKARWLENDDRYLAEVMAERINKVLYFLTHDLTKPIELKYQPNLEEHTLVAEVVDRFMVKGKIILTVNLLKGDVYKGDYVGIVGKHGKRISNVQAIEKSRSFVSVAYENEKVGLFINPSNEEEISFLKGVSHIVNP